MKNGGKSDMNPSEDFCSFSVKKWQRIQALSQTRVLPF